MTLFIFCFFYLLIGLGGAIAIDESKPEKYGSLALVLFIFLWPMSVGYVIARMKV